MIYNKIYLLSEASKEICIILTGGVTMLKRISFNGPNVYDAETNAFIGYIYAANQHLVDIVLQNGSHIYAYFGALDDLGNFHTFCANTAQCGNSCKGTPPRGVACIYNQVAVSRAAFYVDMPQS